VNFIQSIGLDRLTARWERSPERATVWPRSGVAAVWAVLAYNTVFALLLLAHPLSHERIHQIDDLAGAEGPLIVGGFVVFWTISDRFRAGLAKASRWWIGWAPALIALGVVCFGIGENIWSYYEFGLNQQTPFPSWADAGYLAAYPFLLAGILLLPRPSISSVGRARIAFDGLLVMTALGTVSWYFVLGPTILQSYESGFSQVVGSAYPLFDLLLVASLLILSRRTTNRAMRPVVILGGVGLVSVVLVDIVFDYQTLHGSYSVGGVIDVLWSFGYMLLGLAAGFAYRALRRPQLLDSGEERSALLQGQATLFIAYLFVPIAVGLMIYAARSTSDEAVKPGLYIGGSAMIALVLVRQFLVLLDNRKLVQQMARQEERYRTILHTASDAIITVDDSNTILTANPAAEGIFGFSRGELEGSSLDVLLPPALRGSELGSLRSLALGQLATEGDRGLEINGLHRDGREVPLEVAFAVTRQGQTRLLTCFARDISERVHARKELTHQALHDALTKLPNRALLQDRVSQALRSAAREQASAALLLMDLDRFKDVNDTFGHDAGDVLLKEIASRLVRTLRASDTVARLGGDEFAILLPGLDQAEALGIVAKLENAVLEPVEVEGRSLEVGCSIGMAVYPDHGVDPAVLLRHADVAMYVAKRSGLTHSLYEPRHDIHSPTRLTLVSELRRAIATNGLTLHFQPQVDLRSRRIERVEALVRWDHPDRGLMSPADFIPLAEETGLIVDLTAWVLRSSLKEQAAWQRVGLELSMAVNLSARVLRHANLAAQVEEICRELHVSPARLEVEVTESTIMQNPGEAEIVLSQLHDLGLKIAIDDFGTGYSSLGRLKRLPVQQVKIDKSFVLDMERGDADALTIVRSVIELGHNLGLEVVAEGVETARVAENLREMECDVIQGFFVTPPLSSSDLMTWMLAIPGRELELFGAAPKARATRSSKS
jgi:diguanylate cyclase (GGDEF)-like protein/PAS domain S-box-containing protein